MSMASAALNGGWTVWSSRPSKVENGRGLLTKAVSSHGVTTISNIVW